VAGAGSGARRVGVDSGGTFTDVVTDDGRVLKVPSTPDDPGRAVRDGVRAGRPTGDTGRPALLAHGTTVATRAGARVSPWSPRPGSPT
jgi:N-methylhydantoinase A/oxoprolinase/acetone carboxylase beta subunit